MIKQYALGCGSLCGCAVLLFAALALADDAADQAARHGISVEARSARTARIVDRAQLNVAGGRRCSDNSDCRDFQYCAVAAGDCDHDGVCTRRPNICPEIYQPVCGCDGNSYANRCEAAAAGANVAAAGECASPCCEPAAEPGQGGLPACTEGASCCADGTWACNAVDGTPTCPAGTVCGSGEVCGGFAGIACADPDDFCKTAPGECCCDFQGECTARPDACPEVYAPVCGCDGVTYDNACFADAAGVSLDHTGACGAAEVCGGIQGLACADANQFCKYADGECCCDFQGECTDVPQYCPLNYDPVCGCDGVTYGNECLANAARVSVDHRGPCSRTCRTNADCAVTGQLLAEFCEKTPGDCEAEGACAQMPQACLDVYRPVCGCDGQTYSNDCYAQRAGVNVAASGECEGE